MSDLSVLHRSEENGYKSCSDPWKWNVLFGTEGWDPAKRYHGLPLVYSMAGRKSGKCKLDSCHRSCAYVYGTWEERTDNSLDARHKSDRKAGAECECGH